MSRDDVLALFEQQQTLDGTQPIAQGDQGAAWVAQANGDAASAPLPPPPMPEAVAPAPPVAMPEAVTPPPPPAMPEVATPAAATTMAAPAEKSTGGWEVDSYRLRAFGDAVVRARAYLDAVRMKVDRMQGAELTPQLGTSPVGQQLAKKFDDRLNADHGLRAMLTEAMKRMERFVTTAEEASRAYEQAEETAVEDLDKFRFAVDWWDEDAPSGHGHHGHHGHGYHHDHGQDDEQGQQEEPAQDQVTTAEPAVEPGGEEPPADVVDEEADGEDRPQDAAGAGQDKPTAGNGRGKPG